MKGLRFEPGEPRCTLSWRFCPSPSSCSSSDSWLMFPTHFFGNFLRARPCLPHLCTYISTAQFPANNRAYVLQKKLSYELDVKRETDFGEGRNYFWQGVGDYQKEILGGESIWARARVVGVGERHRRVLQPEGSNENEPRGRKPARHGELLFACSWRVGCVKGVQGIRICFWRLFCFPRLGAEGSDSTASLVSVIFPTSQSQMK